MFGAKQYLPFWYLIFFFHSFSNSTLVMFSLAILIEPDILYCYHKR